MGDFSKKTFDSVVESEGFSRFVQSMVEALPIGFLYFFLTICGLGTVLLLLCYKFKQQTRMAVETVDVLSDIAVRNTLGIFICFIF